MCTALLHFLYRFLVLRLNLRLNLRSLCLRIFFRRFFKTLLRRTLPSSLFCTLVPAIEGLFVKHGKAIEWKPQVDEIMEGGGKKHPPATIRGAGTLPIEATPGHGQLLQLTCRPVCGAPWYHRAAFEGKQDARTARLPRVDKGRGRRGPHKPSSGAVSFITTPPQIAE